MPCQLELLPPEIWFQIYSILPSSSVRSVTLTCKISREIAQPLLFSSLTITSYYWSKHTYESYDRLERLNSIFTSARVSPSVTQFHLFLSEGYFSPLDICGETFMIKDRKVAEVFFRSLHLFVSLQSLTLTFVSITDKDIQQLCLLTNLRHLSITPTDHTIKCLARVLSHTKHLCTLRALVFTSSSPWPNVNTDTLNLPTLQMSHLEQYFGPYELIHTFKPSQPLKILYLLSTRAPDYTSGEVMAFFCDPFFQKTTARLENLTIKLTSLSSACLEIILSSLECPTTLDIICNKLPLDSHHYTILVNAMSAIFCRKYSKRNFIQNLISHLETLSFPASIEKLRFVIARSKEPAVTLNPGEVDVLVRFRAQYPKLRKIELIGPALSYLWERERYDLRSEASNCT